MGHEDARSGLKFFQKPRQTCPLLRSGGTRGIPGQPIAGRRVHPNQPQGTDALGEGIGVLIDAAALEPGGEDLFEIPGDGGWDGAIVMVAGNRQPRVRAHLQEVGGSLKLREKAQGRRIAGEYHMLCAALLNFGHQGSQNAVGVAKAQPAAQNTKIEPGGQAFIEPIRAAIPASGC